MGNNLEQTMTKKDLIALLAGYPEDAVIELWQPQDARDGNLKIVGVGTSLRAETEDGHYFPPRVVLKTENLA